MTILIAVALPEAALLVADGRQSSIAQPVITDTAEKVHLIRQDLMVAVSGAVIATDAALQSLRGAPATSAEALRQQLLSLAFEGTRHVLSLVTEATRTEASFKVALIGAGFDNAGVFLVNGMFGTDMTQPWSDEARIGDDDVVRLMVVGAEERRPMDHLNSQLVEVFRGWGNRPQSDPELMLRIIEACRATIEYVAASVTDVGGRNQFRLLRRNGVTQDGYL